MYGVFFFKKKIIWKYCMSLNLQMNQSMETEDV